MSSSNDEAEVTQSWLEGQTEGVEVACRYLITKAGEAFAKKDDKRAHLLREMADELTRYVLPDLQVAAHRHRVEFLPPAEPTLPLDNPFTLLETLGLEGEFSEQAKKRYPK